MAFNGCPAWANSQSRRSSSRCVAAHSATRDRARAEVCRLPLDKLPEGLVLGKLLLEKLSDAQFRTWSNRLITALASYYVGYSLVLLTGLA